MHDLDISIQLLNSQKSTSNKSNHDQTLLIIFNDYLGDNTNGSKHIPIIYEVITEAQPQITHFLKHLLIFSFLNVALPINFNISYGTETQAGHFTLRGASASY